jgi:ABC-type antimicrobial peptide transport system permease subunit
VDLSAGELGPLSSGKLSSGRTFTNADASSDVAVIDANYAAQNKLTVGSTIAIGDSSGTTTNFKVIGIVGEPAGDNPSDVYIPLAVAQKLANMKNDVNTIYVAASSSSTIGTVSGEISKVLPSETVTTSADLANEVTGSLSSASSLANNLGKWLAIAVLIAAFLLASLLTMAAVSRRVREFGTLKALGWKSRRIVGQVMGEAVTMGIIGGAIGVGLGLAGAELVTKLSPKLTAAVGQTTGTATPGGARQFGFGGGGGGGGGFGGGGGGGGFGGGGGGGGFAAFRNANAAAHTVAVHLAASVSTGVIVLAVVLAVAGGIIAGMFGGWRAARLRPADALSKVA